MCICVCVHTYVYAGKKACLNSVSVDVTVGEFDWEGPLPREGLESANEINHHLKGNNMCKMGAVTGYKSSSVTD